MAGHKTGILIAIFGVAATLVSAVIAANAVFQTSRWGSSPPKHLSAAYIGPIDPLSDLNGPGSTLDIKIKNGKRDVKNLRLVSVTLKNDGQTPILSNDMFEPLSLISDSPWNIVAVSNHALGDGPTLKWHTISEQQVQAEPLLLNPGDNIFLTIYLSWTGTGDIPQPDKAPIHWRARINNLQGISTEPDMASQISKLGPVAVNLFGWGIPFILMEFLIYNGLSVALLFRSDIIRPSVSWTLLLIPFAGLLNISAAEAGTTYIFGAQPLIALPTDNMANLPPLLANAAMIILLGIVTYFKNRKDVAPEGA
jgi:hypothetical protein